MSQLRDYGDGMKTGHGIPGTVVPKASNRSDKVGGRIDNASVGVDFDIQHPGEQVIVECDEAGQAVHSTRMDVAAIAHLVKTNRTLPGQKGHAIGYMEAVKTSGHGDTVKSASAAPAAGLAVASISAPEAVQGSKIKVRFSGAFGRVSFSYAQVFRHDIFLVLVQESAEGDFYEPPGQHAQAVEVSWENVVHQCYPCAHIPFPNGRTAITVLMIDEQEGARLRQAAYERAEGS